MRTVSFFQNMHLLIQPIQKWMCRHPYTAYLAFFIGAPLGLLGAVSICTTVLMLPVLLLTGAL